MKDTLGQGVLSFIERFHLFGGKMHWYNKSWDE